MQVTGADDVGVGHERDDDAVFGKARRVPPAVFHRLDQRRGLRVIAAFEDRHEAGEVIVGDRRARLACARMRRAGRWRR